MLKYVTDVNNKIYLKESIVKTKKLTSNISNVIKINVNDEITNFLGFGSAITESSAFNYHNLSNINKKRFLKDYFSKDGLNYNFGRISIGSNDFSLSSFSYAKKRDLSDFSINHDKEYVIPMLHDILNIKKINLIASPWSPPKMYKRLPILYFGISLSKRYYENYSNYLIRFLNEYREFGINISYITMQNEPLARQRWESCKFSISKQKDFIYKYLLPKLKYTKLLLWDHNKDNLSNIVDDLYEKNNKVAGVAFHYYTGNCFNEIKKIHNKYPNMLLVNSEMCCSYSKYDEAKWIGAAEYYLTDIIGDMNMGVNAYLDWNILLDTKGGPTYKKNYVKSASIIKNDNYIKSPIYYYLYHISHFLSGNDIIVNSECYTNALKVVAIKQKEKIIVVIMNTSNKNIDYNIVLYDDVVSDSISSHGVITYVI